MTDQTGQDRAPAEAAGPTSDDGTVEVSYDWRCPRMGEHIPRTRKDGALPAPCPDCCSVEITERRIDFDPQTLRNHARWIVRATTTAAAVTAPTGRTR